MAKKIARLPAKSKTALKQIIVKNADGDPDTTATIVIQNKIKYIPKISVIIPVYNVEKYLRECLDSVVNQTLKEIEIICVDDGSTDSSLEILKEYAKKDQRITVMRQKNLHAGVARNAGLAIARGEYLSFLDSDDFFELNMLEEMYNKANSANIDIAICRAVSITITDKQSISWIVKEKYLNGLNVFSCNDDNIAKYVFQAIVGFPWNKIYKRSFITTNQIYFASSHHHNDTAFVMTSIVCANSILYMRDEFINYRKRTDSLCHNKTKNTESMYLSIIDTYNRLKDKQIFNKIKQSFINYIFEFCQHYHSKLSNQKLRSEALSYINTLNNKFKLTSYLPNYIYDIDKYNYIINLLEYYPIKIPVILASDDNYAQYMYITMLSILENAHKDTFYDFYLMVPSAFSKKNEQTILSLKEKYNCDIHFLDMKNAFADLTMRIAHITSPTYYRLLAGDFLPETYDKCIYLDVDICVCQDLRELYNIDIANNYIAGVVAAGYYYNEITNCKRLNLPSMKTYVNAGVLLMNLKQIRKDNVTQRFLELSKNNYSSQDQDVINVACYGKLKTLPPKYNVMIERIVENDPRLKELYTEQEINEAKTNPCIIHYADKRKPWNTSNIFMDSYWHAIAKKANFKTDTINEYTKKLNKWWRDKNNKAIDLNAPKTFNEKIQWLKLFASTPDKTRLADKYLVRDWVSEKIGDEYLIPLLGVYDSFDEINFKKLPKRFVIKCNHGCGYNIIVKDKSKLDLNDVKSKLDTWMNENFAFRVGCELHYRDIPPKIIIEKYIENKKSIGGDLYDYKFWCFDGRVHYVQFLSERNTDGLKMAFYDRKWKKQKFVYSYPLDSKTIERPDNLDKMIELAEKLSAGFNHVRVDFYRMDDGKIYFGEMTFTSASGTCKWNNEKTNRYFGKLIKLPKLAYNIDTGEYYKLPKIKKTKKEKKLNLKPYLLFPYYLGAMLVMKFIILPRKKKQVARQNLFEMANDYKNLKAQVRELKSSLADTRTTVKRIEGIVNQQ